MPLITDAVDSNLGSIVALWASAVTRKTLTRPSDWKQIVTHQSHPANKKNDHMGKYNLGMKWAF